MSTSPPAGQPGRPSAGPPAQLPPVPAKPKLAPRVTLAGQMQESAFIDPPWLIEREGSGYIQVSELIYRVAEQSDGRRTPERIARRISKNGMPVSSPTVEGLIAQLLVPRGLVVGADGKV